MRHRIIPQVIVALIASFHISHGRAIRFLVWNINPRHKSSAVDIVHCTASTATCNARAVHLHQKNCYIQLSLIERFLFDGTRLKGVGIEIDPKSIARAPFSSQITSPYKSISYKICV